jgi:hypothetical protein
MTSKIRDERQEEKKKTYFFKPILSASSTRSILRWARSQAFELLADMVMVVAMGKRLIWLSR